MNEWVAFAIVAVICGLLAGLMRMAGADVPGPPDASTDRNNPRPGGTLS